YPSTTSTGSRSSFTPEPIQRQGLPAMNEKAIHPTPIPDQMSTTAVVAAHDGPDLQTAPESPPSNPLYPPEGPVPQGTNPAIAQQMAQEAEAKGDRATGVVGEQIVWEARYSVKEFLGRLILWSLATLGWLCLLAWIWNRGQLNG